jgi:hypothetical protein
LFSSLIVAVVSAVVGAVVGTVAGAVAFFLFLSFFYRIKIKRRTS